MQGWATALILAAAQGRYKIRATCDTESAQLQRDDASNKKQQVESYIHKRLLRSAQVLHRHVTILLLPTLCICRVVLLSIVLAPRVLRLQIA